MKPIRLFDQAPDSFTETPRTPPGAVDYPLPAQRQRGLSLFEPLASQEELDRQALEELDGQFVGPVFWGCIALVVAALAAGWWLT